MLDLFRVCVGFAIMGGSLGELLLCRVEGRRPSYVLVVAGLVLGTLWFVASNLGDTASGLWQAATVLAFSGLFVLAFQRLLVRRTITRR